MADDDKRSHVVLTPAAGVTDLDEWFGQLDAAMHVADDPRWNLAPDSLSAHLSSDEAAQVVQRARLALGDAVDVREEPVSDTIVTDAAGGMPIV